MSKRTIYGCDWCGVEAERPKKLATDSPRRSGRLPKGWRHRATDASPPDVIIEILCIGCVEALDEAIAAVKKHRSSLPAPTKGKKTP